jgi:ribosomal-protein-alanine N-acetyltransferase
MITECRITLATSADARDIARLSREAIEVGLVWSWTPRRVLASVGDAATNVIVARRGAGLLGFAIMSYGDDEAHLLLLAVQAAERRGGIGSALLRWLEATAAVAGMRRLHLETRRRSSVARGLIGAGVRSGSGHSVAAPTSAVVDAAASDAARTRRPARGRATCVDPPTATPHEAQGRARCLIMRTASSTPW